VVALLALLLIPLSIAAKDPIDPTLFSKEEPGKIDPGEITLDTKLPTGVEVAKPKDLEELQRYIQRVGKVDKVADTRMFVGGTEYNPGDPGKVFVTLQKEGVPQDDASCIVEIYSPDNLLYLPYTEMMFLDDGVYYHDFTVPDTLGVYPVIVKCTYLVNEQVRNVTNATRTAGVGAGSITNLVDSDNTYMRFDESAGTFRTVGGQFVFNTFSTANLTLQQISLDMEIRRPQKGTDPVNDTLSWWLYNFTGAKWVKVGTTGYYADDTLVTYTLPMGAASFVNASGHVLARFNDTINSTTDPADTDFYIDFIRADLDSFISNSTVETVAGGSEVHVTDAVVSCDVDSAALTIDPFTFLALLYVGLLLGLAFVKEPAYGLFVGAYGIFFGFLAWTPVGKWLTFLLLGVSFLLLINSGRKL
jgi:hypothetical protein